MNGFYCDASQFCLRNGVYLFQFMQLWGLLFPGGCRAGQVNLDPGAFAGVAGDMDMPAVGFDDVFGQPRP